MKNKKSLIIVGALIIVIAGIFVFKNKIFSSGEADNTVSAGEIAGDLPVLLEFRTDSCPACIEMEPVLEEVKQEYDGIVEVRVLDAYENMALANQYSVKVVPTLFILSPEGETLARHEGYLTVDQIEEAFSTYLGIDAN